MENEIWVILLPIILLPVSVWARYAERKVRRAKYGA